MSETSKTTYRCLVSEERAEMDLSRWLLRSQLPHTWGLLGRSKNTLLICTQVSQKIRPLQNGDQSLAPRGILSGLVPTMDHIVEFAAAGPKNYGYQTKDGKVEWKVRSFTLNMRGQQQLNFDLLKQNIIDEVTEPEEDPREIQVHNPDKIKWDTNTKTLQTVEETKRYNMVFDKRIVDPETFRSYPHGYEKEMNEIDMANSELSLDLV